MRATRAQCFVSIGVFINASIVQLVFVMHKHNAVTLKAVTTGVNGQMTSCGLYITWITHDGQMKRMAALSHIFPTLTLWYSTSKDLATVFAQSDAAATIYYLLQLLFESGY